MNLGMMFKAPSKKIIRDKMQLPGEMFIQRAHRIAASGRNGPRKIVCKFGSWEDREEVFKNRRNLAGSDIFVHEHFTGRVQYMRDCLHRSFRGTVDHDGRRPRLMFDKIWVGEKLYTWDVDKNEPVEIRRHRRGPPRDANTRLSQNPSSSQVGSSSQYGTTSQSDSISSQPNQLSQDYDQNSSQPSHSNINLQQANNGLRLMPLPGQQSYASSLMPPPSSPRNSSPPRRQFTYKRPAEKTPPGNESNKTQEKRGRSVTRGKKKGAARSASLSRNRRQNNGEIEENSLDNDAEMSFVIDSSQLSQH